jgi:hypothetical protein
MKRRLFTVFGCVNVVLGAAGIFLPLLPTTPFLLLAAYLFARSSERWHRWLLDHRQLGPYIHAWRNKSGFTVAQKIRIGLSFTLLLGISAYFVTTPAIRALLAAGWLFWMVMLFFQKTAEAAIPSSD